MRVPRKSFTVRDVLLLIDSNGESEEKVVISEECDMDTWVVIPYNSSLLWNKEVSNRIVDSIGTHNGMIQIWLADKENEHENSTD